MQRIDSKRFRPTLENLEDRLTPAVTFQQLDLDTDGAKDDIRIVGDVQNTKVEIFDDGANGISLRIDANGDGDLADVDLGDRALILAPASNRSVKFDVRLGGGNDTFQYDGLGTFDASTRRVNVKLGSGENAFRFLTDKTIDNQSDVRFNITGGGNFDEVDYLFGAVRNSNLVIQEALGNGNDEGQIRFTGNIDFGSTASFDVDLGNGDNDLGISLRGVGFNDIATTRIDIQGGNDARHRDQVVVEVNDDVGNGVKQSELVINANLLAGNDSFLGGLIKTGFKVDDGSRCTIIAHGGAGRDGINVLDGGGPGTFSIDAGAVLDLRLFGDSGNDSVFVGFSDDPGNPKVLELTGTLRTRLSGGTGNDFVGIQLQNTDTSTGHYDVALNAGDGNDKAIFDLQKNLGTPILDPAGKVRLNGGLGTDKLENLSPADSKVTGFEKK